MHKRMAVVYFLVLFSIVFSACQKQTQYPGFKVKGRHLYDKSGEKVVLRGINKLVIWTDRDGDTTFTEIEKTGANVVRIVWLTEGKPEELDLVISRCIKHDMVPMIECHDATGKWEELPGIIQYWTSDSVVQVIQKHQKYLLLNIANEAGDYQVPVDTFRTFYQNAIQQMRMAGIHVPLIIDAIDWGKNIDILQSQGPALIESDPDHNLMFSIHMWWPRMWGYDAQRVIDELQESVDMELPLIVGEFGNKWEDSEQGEIPYLTILKECQKHEIGWIVWSWGPGNNPQVFLDMTENGMFETLHDWGIEVVETDSFSIRNTSVRPQFIVDVYK